MPFAVHGDSEVALVTQCVRSRSSDAWRHPAHGKVPATETLQKRQNPFFSVGFDGFWLCSFGFRPVNKKTKPSHMPLGASRLTFASNGLNGSMSCKRSSDCFLELRSFRPLLEQRSLYDVKSPKSAGKSGLGPQISSNNPRKSLIFEAGVGDRLATLRVPRAK
jgi:hypothetical protein